jgi:hypothetical protein
MLLAHYVDVNGHEWSILDKEIPQFQDLDHSFFLFVTLSVHINASK